MIKDHSIAKAISKIVLRSEKQENVEQIIRSFVDNGITAQFENTNNQILYGRRGTGKTHLFKVLRNNFRRDGYVVAYIDARTLGSTGQYSSDSSLPKSQKCLLLFRDLLNPIHEALLEAVIEKEADSKTLGLLDDLLASINLPSKISQEESQATTVAKKEVAGNDLKVGIAATGLTATASDLTGTQGETIVSSTSKVVTTDKIVFPALNHIFSKIINLAGIRLLILLDEWSSIPTELQPYLAEFLKHGVLPVSGITLKIAALEQRSLFSIHENGKLYGFEQGADISISQDLDDYYVYDRNPINISKLYSEILLNHISLELPNNYLPDTYGVTRENLSAKMFSDKTVFDELSRSSEGVIRDLLNIFSSAFFDAQRRDKEKIDKTAVLEGARHWFERDKEPAISSDMQDILRRITEEVIGKRKSRSFMLQRDLVSHPMIQKLFDARLIHLVKRGYADKDNPGNRYNIYTLDYGTYVDLLGTTREPKGDFLFSEVVAEDFVVPFDDKRSIRRIILGPDILG